MARRYIHRNPLALGTTPLPDYPWSSLPDYLGHRVPAGWVCTSRLLGYHGGSMRHFAAFTLDDSPELRLSDQSATAAIAVLAEQHAMRTNSSQRGIRGAIATLIDPTPPTTAAERKARERALARRASDPELAHIVDTLGRLTT